MLSARFGVAILVAAMMSIAPGEAKPRSLLDGIAKAFSPGKVVKRKAVKAKKVMVRRKAPPLVKRVGTIVRKSEASTPAVTPKTGEASFYGDGEKLNKHMANGEVFNPLADVCAHRRAKFGVVLRVRNLDNGKTATCRVADRGPAQWTGRILDVSKGIAAQLGMLHSGTARVSIAVME